MNDGGATGLVAQIYALGEDNIGSRINVTKGKIYYTTGKDDSQSTPDDEIATVGKVQKKIADTEIVIPTTGWVEDGNFLSLTVPVDGIKDGMYPIVSTYFDGESVEELEAQEEASGHVVKANPVDGGIKFYVDEVPGVQIPVVVKVM